MSKPLAVFISPFELEDFNAPAGGGGEDPNRRGNRAPGRQYDFELADSEEERRAMEIACRKQFSGSSRGRHPKAPAVVLS